MFRIGSWSLAVVAALCAPAIAFAQPADPAPRPPAPSAQPAATEPHPVEALAELPFLTGPLLSPDGRRIAGRVTVDGNERIGVWTLSDPRETPPQLIALGNVDSFSWAGNDRLVAGVTTVVLFTLGRAALPFPARRVMSHDLSSGKTETLGTSAGIYDHLVYVDPAGRYVLLSMQTELDRPPSVHRIDLATGASVEVQPSRSGVWSWFADADGVVRIGVDYGERRTRIYYRPSAQAALRLLETRRNLLDDSVVDMVRFVSNTERGLIVTNAETGRFAVYEYDFATDTRGAVLFEHPQVDVTTAIFGADGSVDGVFYEDDRPRVRWLNPALERLQQRIDRTFPGKTNIIVNRSRDGNRALIFSSAPDDPGTYYVFDQAARRMEIFASPYDDLQGRAFAPVRPVSYPSRDGLAINGYLTLPAGQGASGLPLVVLPHGGPFIRDSWQFDPQVQFLASRGYAVLQPNFRGSTGYGRDFVERGYGQLGAGMIDDIDDGVDWLVRDGVVDPARVCIMGASYGGYAAMWAAMRSPNRYRCAISWAGPSDLERMLRYDRRYIVAPRYRSERRRQIVGEERTDLDAVSPLRHPERMTVPVLIGHGEQDIRVPVDQSRDLVRALTRRGAAVESVFYPKSGHDFTTPEESVDFIRRVEAFLARHNPARAPAAAGDSHFHAPAPQSSPQPVLK